MKRTWLLWLAFALCLAILLSALAWVSRTTLELDDSEARARRQASLEENVRLALWRMDSALAPLLAQESVRPYFTYSTFLPLDRAYGRMFNPVAAGKEKLVPSPLLAEVSPFIRVHFQFQPDGCLTSPRTPGGSVLRLAVPRHLSPESMEKAKTQLDRVHSLTDRDHFLAVLPHSVPAPVEVVEPLPGQVNPGPYAMAQSRRRNDISNQARPENEYQQRSQAVMQNTNVLAQAQAANASFEPRWAPTDLAGVLMTPLWLNGELVLARCVSVDGQEYVQGCLLDWPAIKAWLLENVEDLLPEADLEAVPSAEPEGQSRLLAALPVRLIPGSLPMNVEQATSPVRLTLAIAWACVLVAAAAVALLLAGVVRLSERRAAFVSAVTHELRTPLTTFHVYTEMLTEGMVPDAERQSVYLHTLRAEASRLSHLVENVLAYARLERGRSNGRLESVCVDRLIESVQSRLADRARQAEMELVVEGDPKTLETAVLAKPSAVEQILFNLVDNACKYASGVADRRIHLIAQRSDATLQLKVRDHGPGLTTPSSRRLFRAFSKSAQEAANSAPGVGLGLALSKRLARDMGGRLTHDPSITDGACFVLALPVNRTAAREDCVNG